MMMLLHWPEGAALVVNGRKWIQKS